MRPQCLQGCPGVCTGVFTSTRTAVEASVVSLGVLFAAQRRAALMWRVNNATLHKFWIPCDANRPLLRVILAYRVIYYACKRQFRRNHSG
ncbi:hypothetical protein DPMN_125581 [Dreissena polymorpha]|uniref:Uncharacterized protein n=1 Tax=Dreissena polymorpha TaxID=45954 RepID=A0A9D4JT79_DREPO|nr:hypothetical protein DPMN_125581 [Dreissena polymorpha]